MPQDENTGSTRRRSTLRVWTSRERYRRTRYQNQRDPKTAHKRYMEGVVIKDLKDKPKMFWSYIKSRRQESTGVAPLKNKDGFIHSDSSSKVEILNDQFVSAYTREIDTIKYNTWPSCWSTCVDTDQIVSILTWFWWNIPWLDNAFVVPIFKKGENHLPSYYRPVLLTLIACKVLEHIVHS